MIDIESIKANRKTPYVRRGGVYFLFDGEDLVYVGKSIDVVARINTHRKNKVFTTWAFIELHVFDQGPIEEMAIHRFKPKYNKQYVSTSIPLDLLERIQSGEVQLKAFPHSENGSQP